MGVLVNVSVVHVHIMCVVGVLEVRLSEGGGKVVRWCKSDVKGYG